MKSAVQRLTLPIAPAEHLVDRALVTDTALSPSLQKVLFFLAAGASFVLYTSTLAPTLQTGDAGEQIAAAHVLGVAHPLGTPLYLLLMKIWELLLPFGEVAWRMNLLNAVLGALTIGVIALLMVRLWSNNGRGPWESFLASLGLALVWATSKTFWFESTGASSYVLFQLFTVLWMYAFITLRPQFAHTAALLWLISGLSLACHVAGIILILCTIVLTVSWLGRRKLSITGALLSSLCAAPGLLCYGYIPLRAAAAPPVNWGKPDNWERFIAYITRENYHAKGWVTSGADLLTVVLYHLQNALSDLSPLLFLFAACAALLVACTRLRPNALSEKGKLLSVGVLLFVFNCFFVGLHGSHTDILLWTRYFLPGYFGLFLCAAVLISTAAEIIPPRARPMLTAIVFAVALLNLVQHYCENNRSGNFLLREYVLELLSQVPPDSTLAAQGDNNLFPLLYFHLVEGMRPDINLASSSIGYGDEERAKRDLAEGRYFATHFHALPPPLLSTPYGLVFRISSGDQSAVPKLRWNDTLSDHFTQGRAPLEKLLLTSRAFRKAVYHKDRGELSELKQTLNLLERSAAGFDDALMLAAAAYELFGDETRARRCAEQALLLNPKHPLASRKLRENQPH